MCKCYVNKYAFVLLSQPFLNVFYCVRFEKWFVFKFKFVFSFDKKLLYAVWSTYNWNMFAKPLKFRTVDWYENFNCIKLYITPQSLYVCYYHIAFHLKAFQKSWKTLLISFRCLFSFPRYLNFCIFFPPLSAVVEASDGNFIFRISNFMTSWAYLILPENRLYLIFWKVRYWNLTL